MLIYTLANFDIDRKKCIQPQQLLIFQNSKPKQSPILPVQFLVFYQVARQLQIQLEPENVYLPSPLSTLGEHKVRLRLPKSIPKAAGEDWILNIKIRKR